MLALVCHNLHLRYCVGQRNETVRWLPHIAHIHLLRLLRKGRLEWSNRHFRKLGIEEHLISHFIILYNLLALHKLLLQANASDVLF